MTTTLPTPTHGAEYTNSATGDKFKYDSDAGAWEGFEGIDRSGDSMTGTIAYPDMLINGNTLTADEQGVVSEGAPELQWTEVYSESPIDQSIVETKYGNGVWVGLYDNGDAIYTEDASASEWKLASPWTARLKAPVGLVFDEENGLFYSCDIDGRMTKSVDGKSWEFFGSMASGGGFAKSYTYAAGKHFIGATSGSLYFSTNNASSWIKKTSSTTLVGTSDILSVSYLAGIWTLGSKSTKCSYNTDDKLDNSSFIASRTNAISSAAHIKMITSETDILTLFESSSQGKTYSISTDGGVLFEGQSADPLLTSSSTLTSGAYAHDLWIVGSKKGQIFAFKDPKVFSDAVEQTHPLQNKINSISYSEEESLLVATSHNRIIVSRYGESGAPRMYFNGDPVVIDRGQTKSLARSVSNLSSRLGTSKYYQSDEPSDSFGIDNGTLWLNPSNAKLSIYHDSDWNQLN